MPDDSFEDYLRSIGVELSVTATTPVAVADASPGPCLEKAEYKTARAEFKAAKKAARQARNREIRAQLEEQRRQLATRKPEQLRFTAAPGGELATLRQQCHDAFDPLWKSGRLRRQEMYARLAHFMGLPVRECHFGMFDCELCRRALALIDHPSFIDLPLAATDPMAEPE